MGMTAAYRSPYPRPSHLSGGGYGGGGCGGGGGYGGGGYGGGGGRPHPYFFEELSIITLLIKMFILFTIFYAINL